MATDTTARSSRNQGISLPGIAVHDLASFRIVEHEHAPFSVAAPRISDSFSENGILVSLPRVSSSSLPLGGRPLDRKPRLVKVLEHFGLLERFGHVLDLVACVPCGVSASLLSLSSISVSVLLLVLRPSVARVSTF